MATKAKLSEKLTAAGVAHDPEDTVKNLQALVDAIPAPDATPAATDPAAPAPDATPAPVATGKAANADRQARWDAFLADARTVNPARFDRQKENGEFDTIPASFA